jgi:hypothetical protein
LQKRSSNPRYKRLFYSHCFNCANFGHKVVNCRSYFKNKSNYAGYLNNSYPKKYYEAYNRNENSFGSLRNEVECYKCHNYGYISRNCRSMMDTSMKENIDIIYNKIWKRKKEQVKEEHIIKDTQESYCQDLQQCKIMMNRQEKRKMSNFRKRIKRKMMKRKITLH